MASNKTKLADANAKSAFDFDDDFESMFDDDDIGGKKKSPVQEFMAGFKDGILDKGKNKSLLRAFITNGAPKGYDRLFGMYDQVKDGASSMKDHLERTNPGDLQYLFKRAESLLPSVKDKLSESAYDRINTALSNKVDQYKYQIEANQDQNKLAIRRRATEDEATIKEALGEDLRSAVDNSTVVTRSLFNKGQANEQRRWDLDRIERGMRDQVEDRYKQKVSRGLAQAVDALTRVASYTEQVNYDFQRKGLELQFRSYMALRDISKLTEASLEMQNKAFQALVRNTGLPDHLKSSMKDLVGMNMRQGMAQAGSSMVGKTLSSFLGGYGSNVQNRVNGKASSALSGMVQGLQAGEGMSDFWDQRYRLAGGMAADGAQGFARNTIAPMVGRLARPAMTRLSNKHGQGRHNQVGYAADNMPAMLQEFVNNYQNSTGAKGVLQDMLRPFTPQFGLDQTTKAGNFQTIGQHTTFNQLSQRTLVEVLPGYQARILREIRMLRTGKDVPMEVFDITRGRFTTAKEAETRLSDRIVSKGTAKMVSGQLNETMDQFDKEKKLSPEARKVLSERLLRDSASGKRFDPMRYGSKFGYQEGADKDTVKELEEFFKGQYERDDKGKFAQTKENFAKRKEMSDSFLNVRNVARDPAAEIHRMIEAGNTIGLRELGIIETVEGVDRINYPMLWKMMSTEVSGQHAGDGARYGDASGDKDDRNFVGPQHPGMVNAKILNAADKFKRSDLPGRIKDGTDRAKAGARDIMDQFKADPGQFMRDQFEAGKLGAKNRIDNIKESGAAALDAAKAGGLPAVLEHFSAQEKLDFVKALLNNAIDKEPPAMKEARLKLAQTILDSISSGKDAVKSAADSELGQQAQAGGRRILAVGSDALDQAKRSEAAGVIDLRVKDATAVAIRAIDMLQGKLVDVNTNKVIEKASDITGEVRNNLGQQVLSAEEAARGLYSDRDQLIVKGRVKLDAVKAAVMAHAQKTVDGAKDKLDDMKDWCLEGSDKVIIRSRELLEGAYIDAETNEPIYSLDDIKGDLMDHSGRLIATAQELGRGLVSRDGDKFDIPGMRERAMGLANKLWRGNTTQNVLQAMKMAGGFAWKLARNTVARITGDRDAYIPGNAKPVLTVEKLKEGLYFDKDQKPIRSMGDINGPVFDENNEPLLDKDELKSLVDVNGKKHSIAKNQGLARRLIRGAVKGYWNMTKKYYGALGKELGNDAMAGLKTVAAPLGAFSKRQLAALSTTDQVLVQIRDAIRETVPKKNRKGSWMDQKEVKDKETLAKEAKSDKDQKETKGLFGKLSATLGGLWNKMRGKDKGEEEDPSLRDQVMDGVDDLNSAKDLLGGGGDDGPDRRSRRGGRLRRWGRKIGQSKIVRKIATSRVGMLAGRGAMAVGSMLAGLISAPVLLGAAAVVGVGVAGYFTYKYFSSAKAEFISVRMLQYGITSTRQRHKILALEKLFEKTSMRGQNPQLNIAGAGGAAVMEIMGFKREDEASIHRFARWMDVRFKPVFCQWLKAIDTVGKTQMSLSDIDEKLDEPLKGSLVKEIQMPYGEGSIFTMRDNPFGDDEPLDDTEAETKERIEAMIKKYKEAAEANAALLPGKKAEPTTPDAKSNVEAGALVGATATAVAKKAAEEALATGKKANEAAATPITAATISKIAGGVVPGIAVALAMPVPLPGSDLLALDAIRARAYGMESLVKVDMESLIALETRVDIQSAVDAAGMVKFTGNLESFIVNAGGLFGLNTADAGPDRVKFVNWLTNRFMPVCEAFLTSARTVYRGKPGGAAGTIKLGDQISIARAVMGAVNGNSESVWKAPSIFPVKGSLSDLKPMADADLEFLVKQADAVLASPTLSAGAQAAGTVAAAGGKSFLSGVGDAISGALGKAKDMVADSITSTGKALSSAASTVAGMRRDAVKAVGTGIASAAQSTYEFFGGETGELTKGNGGQWEQVPMPTSKDAKGSHKSLEVISQMTGVPLQFLMVFCAMESNFDWSIKAGAGGSATGWFQFINSTWDWVLAQHSGKYGIPADKIPARPLRLDPRINGLMGAEYIKYSMGVIKKGTGRDPTDVELYLAHFMGPGTAVKWMNMPQNTLGYTAFPKEAAANPSVFYSGRSPRTLAEIMQSFDKRMAKFRAIAAGVSGTAQAAPLSLEEIEKRQLAEKSKELEGEAKKEFIPGVSAMPGGPTATGSTPTNTGTGGPTMLSAGKPTQAPAGSSGPVGIMAPAAAPQSADNAPDGSGAGSNAGAQAAQAASTAKDALRAKDVQRQTANDTAINNVQQEQLQTQKDMLDVLKQIAAGQGAKGEGNSMPKQQSRKAVNSPVPVNV